MNNAIDEIKIRAALLHKQLRGGHKDCLARLAALPEFRGRDPETWVGEVQRKHCLAALASEGGFSNWVRARAVLAGNFPEDGDFGTLLHPRRCSGFLNEWFANVELAREALALRGGHLLVYRRQYFVVTQLYVRTLGLDPLSEHWRELGHDWSVPGPRPARAALYGQLLAHERGS